MKTSLFCNALFLLVSIGSAASNVEVSNALQTELALDADYEVDAERELLTKKEKLAKKEAKKAKRAAKKAARKAAKKAAKKGSEPEYEPYEPYEPEPAPVPAPAPRYETPEILYKEIIYMEQMCVDYLQTTLNGTVTADDTDTIQLGDTRSFKCKLFETAIQFGQFGGTEVGTTYWYCRAFAFSDVQVVFERVDFAVWDCTITDFIGLDDNEGSAIRNEGIAVLIDEPDITRDLDADNLWANFHSHTGRFATVGGILTAKGARGQVEVEWDDFRQTWYHVYTIEVWALEQTPLLPFAIP